MGINTSNETTSMAISVLAEKFAKVRKLSLRIAAPLSSEDCAIQSMPDVSPTRWHLAHTTWFFETFVLKQTAGYRPFDENFEFLFNSYYNTVGEQYPRHRRGLISRPTLETVLAYRDYVDEHISQLLQKNTPLSQKTEAIIDLGLHHEQQHQELMLTDVKHVLSCNPLHPAYETPIVAVENQGVPSELSWYEQTEALVEIGFSGEGFCFDNECPRHRTFLCDFQISSRCVTNQDYQEFMRDGGYQKPELWLSLGWATVRERNWEAPLYWLDVDGTWKHFTLGGLTELQPHAPVTHVSYFEADAFARWAGARLPTEAEWEHSAATESSRVVLESESVFADMLMDKGYTIHPFQQSAGAANMMGNVWEWTSSHYSPYPGFEAAAGALGEYNGKFMCNQFVLRGGSCATSSDHIRPTYRNFFPADTRWQILRDSAGQIA